MVETSESTFNIEFGINVDILQFSFQCSLFRLFQSQELILQILT